MTYCISTVEQIRVEEQLRRKEKELIEKEEEEQCKKEEQLLKEIVLNQEQLLKEEQTPDTTPNRIRIYSNSSNDFTVSSSNNADEVWEEYAGFYEELKKDKRKVMTKEMEEMILNSISFRSLEDRAPSNNNNKDNADFEMNLKEESDEQKSSIGGGMFRRIRRRSTTDSEGNDDKNVDMRNRLFNSCLNQSSAVEDEKKSTEDENDNNNNIESPISQKADELDKGIVLENDQMESYKSDDEQSTSSTSSGFFGYFQKKKLTLKRSTGRLA